MEETTLIDELSCLSTLGPTEPVQITTDLLKIDEQRKTAEIEETTPGGDVEDLDAQL